MSRCMSLEEYLERFVDENIESADEEITLIVPDAQAHTLGLFFLNGLAGYIECVRTCRESRQCVSTESDEDGAPGDQHNEADDFIN